jgi:hypothetical protein
MIGALTYTDILIIILIYLMVAVLGVLLYPKLRGYGERERYIEVPRRVQREIPKTVMAEYSKKRNGHRDDFYSELFSKSEAQVAEELGLNSHDSKPEKKLKKKKNKVNHNEA